MMEIIPGLPENVVAVTVSGILTGEDYERVLIPAIEDKVQKYEKIRLIYQLSEKYKGFNDKAMLEDARFDIRYFAKFEKIAFVSNVDWIINTIKVLKFVIPGSVRTYRNEELPEAKAWISE